MGAPGNAGGAVLCAPGVHPTPTAGVGAGGEETLPPGRR